MPDIRRATIGDIGDIDRLVRTALNTSSREHGFPEIPPGPPNPFYAFAIAEEPEGAFVAEEAGAVVGVAVRWLRPPAWFLAHLFVDPRRHGQGHGRRLIERVLAEGGEDAAFRTLITPAFNPVSISLYMRYGMYPAEPLYAFDAAAAQLRERLAGRALLESEILAADADAAPLLGDIDGALLEMTRAKLHRQLLRLPGIACHLFRAAGEGRGYAYVSPRGQVGPVAALAPLSFPEVFETALGRAAAISQDRVGVLLAGSNMAAMAAAVRLQMRLVRPVLLMASRRFGDWSRYAPHSPGVM
ncbi:MAG TPA: GNAT family N-acetyltransferase [Stellaceae bacterium]|nr:GNAT family N-acetyltransferase [Stellaceae bacterium]